jgi:predicted nuclease with TOPRIM domain
MELILVYNADSGFFNIVKDGLNKVVSPSTYQCNLCALTYGTIRMKDEWKTYISKLEIPTTFLHRDEFLRKLKNHPHDVEGEKFPAVFLEKEGKISVLITSAEINRCESLKDLMNLITETLSKV